MALLEFLGDILSTMTAGNRAKSRLWRWVERVVFWTIAAFAAYLLYVMFMRGGKLTVKQMREAR